MMHHQRFASSVTCEGVCFQNLLVSAISSSNEWSTIKLLLAIILRSTLLSYIFFLPIRSPSFLFLLYVMIGYYSNAVLRFEWF